MTLCRSINMRCILTNFAIIACRYRRTPKPSMDRMLDEYYSLIDTYIQLRVPDPDQRLDVRLQKLKELQTTIEQYEKALTSECRR